MNRDKKEFSDYWLLSGFDERIEYHTSLDFECNNREIVIIDEADHLMLREPIHFKKYLKNVPTICLTSTLPDSTPCSIESVV